MSATTSLPADSVIPSNAASLETIVNFESPTPRPPNKPNIGLKSLTENWTEIVQAIKANDQTKVDLLALPALRYASNNESFSEVHIPTTRSRDRLDPKTVADDIYALSQGQVTEAIKDNVGRYPFYYAVKALDHVSAIVKSTSKEESSTLTVLTRLLRSINNIVIESIHKP